MMLPLCMSSHLRLDLTLFLAFMNLRFRMGQSTCYMIVSYDHLALWVHLLAEACDHPALRAPLLVKEGNVLRLYFVVANLLDTSE